MKHITVSKKNWNDVLRESVRVLRRGGVVVYPTETSYALGADATKKRSVRKVFHIKGRERTKLLSVLVANKIMIRRYAKFTATAKRLWDAFLPGPLTIIIPGRRGGTMGIRLSTHPFAALLVKSLGHPITATSANISGASPIHNANDILSIFSGRLHKPNFVIDAGILPKHSASTVVDCTGQSVQLLRKGPITATQIKKALR